MSGPRLALIAARGHNGVIGVRGGLPWRLPDDLARFRALTWGKPICAGRRTWESFSVRPLPGRANLVLTRNPDYPAPGAERFSELGPMLARAFAIAEAEAAEEVMIVGGEALYRLTLPLADRLYLTEVETSVEGDACFPAFAARAWRTIEVTKRPADDSHDTAFTWRVLERRARRQNA